MAAPYTSSQSINPYTGDQCVAPYTGGTSIDPYAGDQGVNTSSLDANALGGLNYTPAEAPSSSISQNFTPVDAAMVLGATLPSGNYDMADSVKNAIRTAAREIAGDTAQEAFESGIYDNQTADFIERHSYDALNDLMEGRFSWQTGHWESLASTPQAGTEASNLNIVTPVEHRYAEHAGDTMNNPAEFANPDYNVDPAAEEMFGEGSNVRIVPEAENLGMGGEGVPSSAIDWFAEGEGEILETLSVTAEAVEGLAVEGLELADLLLLLLLLPQGSEPLDDHLF
jgi:hypothetical protein